MTTSRFIRPLGLVAVGLVANAVAPRLHAQITITNSSPIVLNFDNLNTDFGGAYNAVGGSSPFPTTAQTAPTTIYSGVANPALIASGNDFAPGGVYSNTGTYSNSNSFRALSDSDSADLALGVKDSNDRSFTLRLQNNTGAPIDAFDLSYAVEQYSIADSPTIFSLSYSLNGTTFVTTNLVGGGSVAAATNGAAADANLTTVLRTAVSGTINESVADTSELFIRFTYDHQTGTSVHLGLDDLSVAAVPEPSAAIALLSGVGILVGLRRRAQK